MFSIPFAAIPLAAWVGDRRSSVAMASGRSGGQTVKMVLAWLVSLNVAWSVAANKTAEALGAAISPTARNATGTCDRDADYAALAAEPATTVLAISNLGSPILANSHHRALAGPYHRNVAADLLMLKAFTGSRTRPAQSLTPTRRAGRALPRQRRNLGSGGVGAALDSWRSSSKAACRHGWKGCRKQPATRWKFIASTRRPDLLRRLPWVVRDRNSSRETLNKYTSRDTRS